jgi:hypothetical protein
MQVYLYVLAVQRAYEPYTYSITSVLPNFRWFFFRFGFITAFYRFYGIFITVHPYVGIPIP